MAPVNLEGCGRQNALRSALAFMKEVKSAGAVLPPVQSKAKAADPVHVPGTSRPRHSTIVELRYDLGVQGSVPCRPGAFNEVDLHVVNRLLRL